jgi:hypothetical protein
MRLRMVGTVFLVGILAILAASSATSATPLLSVVKLYGEGDYLCVDFHLKNAVDKELVTSLREGIPALLTYRLDVWRERSSWYDKLIKTVSCSYKITYDNWDTLFCISKLGQSDTEQTRAPEVAGVVHTVCNQKAMKTCRMDDLDLNSSYYVTISAEIQSLSAERVREIESWLGGEEAEDAGGGLLGFVVGLFTSNGKRAETRSHTFSLKGLTSDWQRYPEVRRHPEA